MREWALPHLAQCTPALDVLLGLCMVVTLPGFGAALAYGPATCSAASAQLSSQSTNTSKSRESVWNFLSAKYSPIAS